MTAETEDSPTGRSLLDLPYELWTVICELAIDDLTPNMRVLGPGLYKRVQQPAITRVNHLLRTEMLPYFYDSAFRITIRPHRRDGKYVSDTAHDLRVWLHRVSYETRKALRTVVLLAEPADFDRKLAEDLCEQLDVDLQNL